MAQTSTRTRAEIEAEIAAARQRLADNVEGLINQVHPAAVVQRGIDDARTYAAGEFAEAKRRMLAEDGTVRVEKVAWLVAAVAGTVAFLMLLRSIVRGGRR